MIRASDLLNLVPNLPAHSQDTLRRLIATAGDVQLHIPGLPSGLTPSALLAGAGPIHDLVIATLGQFDFTFYQEIGVEISLKGATLVGLGAHLSETLNVKSPAPNLKIAPVLNLGPIKE